MPRYLSTHSNTLKNLAESRLDAAHCPQHTPKYTGTSGRFGSPKYQWPVAIFRSSLSRAASWPSAISRLAQVAFPYSWRAFVKIVLILTRRELEVERTARIGYATSPAKETPMMTRTRGVLPTRSRPQALLPVVGVYRPKQRRRRRRLPGT